MKENNSNVIHLFSEEESKNQATIWVAKLDRGLSASEELQLKLWLSKSQNNRDYFIEYAKQWDEFSVLERLSELMPYQKATIKKKRYFLYAAASFLLLVSLAYWQITKITFWNLGFESEVAFSQVYQTKVGGNRTIYLPDTSKVILNTDSLINVYFTDENRILELQRGEVLVDVAHDTNKPFIVVAGNKSFQAVGTAFNVEFFDNHSIELIVTEGTVLAGDASLLESNVSKFKNAIKVKAGQKARVSTRRSIASFHSVDEMASVDISSALSWRDGKIIFSGHTLSEVVEEISRYSDVSIKLEGENIHSIKVGGQFSTNNINELIDTLSEQFDIQKIRKNSTDIVLRK